MLNCERQPSSIRTKPHPVSDQDQIDRHAILEQSIDSVREALSGLKFGNVSLTVHEGRVVQIDVTEKRRLRPA